MVEPGHYVSIIAEGRLSDSSGISMAYLGKLMYQKGCQVALNLDGGQTGVMLFMGKQLNTIGIYNGAHLARPTSEILGIGYSAQALATTDATADSTATAKPDATVTQDSASENATPEPEATASTQSSATSEPDSTAAAQ